MKPDPPTLQMKLAWEIRLELGRLGLTQKDLAQRTDLTEKHVSRMLKGRDDGSLAVWERMAEALGAEWSVALFGMARPTAHSDGDDA